MTTSCLFRPVASVMRPLSNSSEMLIVAVLVGVVALWSLTPLHVCPCWVDMISEVFVTFLIVDVSCRVLV